MVSVLRAVRHHKYLRIAFDIDDLKVSFSLWVLMEICQDSFDSLRTGAIKIRR
jgi:hypothetical protein